MVDVVVNTLQKIDHWHIILSKSDNTQKRQYLEALTLEEFNMSAS